jgi:hypothetical protein
MTHQENSQIEIGDLSDSDTDLEVGVELSAFELATVSGGLSCSWKSGTGTNPKKCDEWD